MQKGLDEIFISLLCKQKYKNLPQHLTASEG